MEPTKNSSARQAFSPCKLFAAAAYIPVSRQARALLALILACTNTSKPDAADYMVSRVSQSYLSLHSECSLDSVQRALAELKGAGVILTTQRGLTRTNETRVDADRLVSLSVEARAFRGANAPKQPSQGTAAMPEADAAEAGYKSESLDLESKDLRSTGYPPASAEHTKDDGTNVPHTPTLSPIESEIADSYGCRILEEAQKHLQAAYDEGVVAESSARKAHEGIKKRLKVLGAIALAAAIHGGIRETEFAASVREWAFKCVDEGRTPEHYANRLGVFIRAKGECVGKMSGRLESS